MCNGPLSFYRVLFSLSLSFIPLFSSLLFKENRAPFIVPLSSGLQTHTQKREPYTTTTAISLSASQNILYIWCVFGLSICVSDVLFAFASHPIEKEREMNSYSCVQSTATF